MFLVSGELSNLVRMRNSAIGKSAPSLSVHVVRNFILVINIITYITSDIYVFICIYLFLQRDFNIPRRAAKAAHRKSFIATTSPTLPRCHSPLSGM